MSKNTTFDIKMCICHYLIILINLSKMKKLLLLSAIAFCAAANAQVTPRVQPEEPVNGKSYILVNKAQTAEQYTSRTGWDGAFYFLGEEASNYANHALTAVANEDGSWYFTLPNPEEPETPVYFYVPYGSPNANTGLEPAQWFLDKKADGFYNLILGEGNNAAATALSDFTPTKDLRLHLNNGSQYFVVTYFAGPWYPDCVGGVTENEDESTGDVFFAANDSTSFCWGFVSVDRIPDYYQDLKSVATINNYYNRYCNIEDYEEGFLASYNACKEIYESSEYTIDDAEIITAMINGKIALFNEIESAIALNIDDDAALNAAIANAKAAFDKAVAATEVETATKTLKDAVAAYSMGTGDVTAFGTNMSFEDLSAQGGAESSSVAGVPTGWNIFINGTQVFTADDVKAQGIGAWHGVNSDSEGEIKDGAQSFGIWNGSIPSFELSQTIAGLENGTYEITAGLMAGSNGNGSRLTTQRIFGNLNATYYASEFDYDLSQLDKSEVPAFAGNEIITTDREMRPVTVKAFVYDGTLTFGVRTDGNILAANRTTSNGAGGDGWFKVDNFKIMSKGYVPEDGVAIYEYFNNQVGEFATEQMATSVKEALENAAGANIDENSSLDEIVAAINTAKELVVTAGESVNAYRKLRDAIDSHYESFEQYQNKLGAGEYQDVIMEAENTYSDGSAQTVEEVMAVIAELDQALQDCIQSDEIEEGADLTEYITNPSFEDLSSQNGASSSGVAPAPKGWNIYVEGELCNTVAELNKAGVTNWCAINEGDGIDVTNTQGEQVYTQYTDGNHLWGLWSGAVPAFELSQTIKGLPAGSYTLTADIVVQNDWAGMNLGMQRLFANDYVTMFGAEDDYMQNFDDELYETFPEDVLNAAKIDAATPDADFKHLNYAGNYSYESYEASSAPYTTTVQLGLPETGDITFGVRSSRVSAVDGQLSSQASLGWIKVDNFRLTYDSVEVPAGAEVTGINNVIESNKATAVSFYSVNGVRLSAPQKGINIVKMANGTVSKVLVK